MHAKAPLPPSRPVAAPAAGADPAARAAAVIPVAVTARHVHLSPAHVEALFGPGAALQPLVRLTQPGEFAAQLTVEVRGPAGGLQHVRVLGPPRARTVVELSAKDAAKIGVLVPQRPTALLAGSPGCVLAGPKGTLVLGEGVLITGRHLHAPPDAAASLGLVDDELVALHALHVLGDRARALRDVVVRVRAGARLELHVDVEEAGALDVGPATTAAFVER